MLNIYLVVYLFDLNWDFRLSSTKAPSSFIFWQIFSNSTIGNIIKTFTCLSVNSTISKIIKAYIFVVDFFSFINSKKNNLFDKCKYKLSLVIDYMYK